MEDITKVAAPNPLSTNSPSPQVDPATVNSSAQSPSIKLTEPNRYRYIFLIVMVLMITSGLVFAGILMTHKPLPVNTPSTSQPKSNSTEAIATPTTNNDLIADDKWKIYSSNDAKYSISYPNNWIVTPVNDGKPGEIWIQNIDGAGIHGSIQIDPYNNQGVTMPIEKWVSETAAKFNEECSKGGCGGGSIMTYIGESSLANNTAYKTFMTAPGPLAGYYVYYFIPKGDQIFTLILESDLESNNFDEGNSETAQVFQRIIQSIKFKNSDTTEVKTTTKKLCTSNNDCAKSSFCDISVHGGMTPNGYQSSKPTGSQICIPKCSQDTDCSSKQCIAYNLVSGDIVTTMRGCKQ